MTHEDRGHYAKKHSPDRTVKTKIVDGLKKHISEGEISCAAAHKVARNMGEMPSEVGFTIDSLEVRIAKCQMGLFGYEPEKKVVKPADNVPESLEKTIRSRLENGKLPCKAAWDIAEQFDLKKIEVSAVCETLEIKISPCQLGAF